MGRVLHIPVAKVFLPLLQPARFKLAKGGRGSAKSNFYASYLVEKCLNKPGLRALCIREIQNSIADSSKRLIEDYIKKLGLESHFEIMHDVIRTPGNGFILFRGMRGRNDSSVKSIEGINIVWVEEAQDLSEDSLTTLRPSIRDDESEIWFSLNPNKPTDAVDKFFNENRNDPNFICVHANFDDNPWFPRVLELERQIDLKGNRAEYEWIWEGKYRQSAGAYFNSEYFLDYGNPVRFPSPVDYVFAVIDTSLKGGRGCDGTAVCYFSVNKLGRNHNSSPLVILDWDIVEFKSVDIKGWLPSVYEKLNELSAITHPRNGVLPLFIEDRAAGCVLLQECEKIGWPAVPIDSKLTELGKDVRAFNSARYVNSNQVKISDYAWDKTSVFADETANHFRKQIFDFRIGDPKASRRQDDLLDCFCYGCALSLGNNQGF